MQVDQSPVTFETTRQEGNVLQNRRPIDEACDTAAMLMAGFAERTGLSSALPGRRYLWTDAFAVCNFLGLARATGDETRPDIARSLVDRVHHLLGQHRQDDPRSGWISGLRGAEAEAHPTRGGLRIGKKLPERAPGEPVDERLEWDRDGQYFHYLTRWMHALDQMARATLEPRYNLWARELATTAHRAFTRRAAGGQQRMVWKMNIDLSRVLVGSMGQHDPLDGLITAIELEATAAAPPAGPTEPTLENIARDFASMTELRALPTVDPLGLGGLLVDAARVAQLRRFGAFAGEDLLEMLLAVTAAGLTRYAQLGELRRPARQRLAFRELGLSIGLSSLALVERELDAQPERFSRRVRSQLDALKHFVPLRTAIESFWLDPEHRAEPSWSDHLDINEVMLATSLVPEGFTELTWPR